MYLSTKGKHNSTPWLANQGGCLLYLTLWYCQVKKKLKDQHPLKDYVPPIGLVFKL